LSGLKNIQEHCEKELLSDEKQILVEMINAIENDLKAPSFDPFAEQSRLDQERLRRLESGEPFEITSHRSAPIPITDEEIIAMNPCLQKLKKAGEKFQKEVAEPLQEHAIELEKINKANKTETKLLKKYFVLEMKHVFGERPKNISNKTWRSSIQLLRKICWIQYSVAMIPKEQIELVRKLVPAHIADMIDVWASIGGAIDSKSDDFWKAFAVATSKRKTPDHIGETLILQTLQSRLRRIQLFRLQQLKDPDYQASEDEQIFMFGREKNVVLDNDWLINQIQQLPKSCSKNHILKSLDKLKLPEKIYPIVQGSKSKRIKDF